ncbi:transposase [Streptomyces sp. NPDC004539]|uniref:IS701 family transposase n=1 Tax=Streptomyces sp. NPDC004539 TaxID=3154280 RepID=UPI0033BC4642
MADLEFIRRFNDVGGSIKSPDVMLDEIGSILFASLARSDQRHKGMTYLKGLLGAQGRKSVRNIAAHVGGATTEQSLHHFISESTWDWNTIRQALSRHLARVAPPRAWVAQPMVIPKAGEYSVGVDRKFYPKLGQVLNAQQAVGVWAISENFCYPVNWRLHLPAAWLTDRSRRSRAMIPDDRRPESLGECMAHVFGAMQEWGVPTRPTVLDFSDSDVATVRSAFRDTRAPLLVKVGSTFPLKLTDQASPAGHRETLPAHHIMRHVKDLRRPVVWRDRPTTADRAPSAVAVARVRLPGHLAPRSQNLLLLSTGQRGRPWPGELWLTNMLHASPSELVQLTCLRHQVDQALASVGDRVGLRDYAGRSYSGWHRHITMASAAHAVAVLSG